MKRVSKEIRLVNAVRAQLSPTIGAGWVRPAPSGRPHIDVGLVRTTTDTDARAVVPTQTLMTATSTDGGFDASSVRTVGFPMERPSAPPILSPSGRLAVSLVTTGADKAAKRFVRITCQRAMRVIRSIEVTKLHGAFVTSTPDFAGLAWTAEEDAIVYVADRNAPKRTSKERSGWENNAVDDWGELITPMARPGLFVLSLISGNAVGVHTDVPSEHQTAAADAEAARAVAVLDREQEAAYVGVDEMAAGTPQLARLHGEDWLLWSAVSALPRRFGLRSCINRPWSVWAAPLSRTLSALHKLEARPETKSDSVAPSSKDDSGKNKPKGDEASAPQPAFIARLSEAAVAARSPRVAADASTLLWLQTPHLLTHDGASALVQVDFAAWAERTMSKAGNEHLAPSASQDDSNAAASASSSSSSSSSSGEASAASTSSSDESAMEGVAATVLQGPGVEVRLGAGATELVPRLRGAAQGRVLRADSADGTAVLPGLEATPCADPEAFCGLYLLKLPDFGLTADGAWCLTGTPHGIGDAVLRISLDAAKTGMEPGTVQRLAVNPGTAATHTGPESVCLLDVCQAGGSVALVTGGSLVAPDAAALVDAGGDGAGAPWVTVWSPSSGSPADAWAEQRAAIRATATESDGVLTWCGGAMVSLPQPTDTPHPVSQAAGGTGEPAEWLQPTTASTSLDLRQMLRETEVARVWMWRHTADGADEADDPSLHHSSAAATPPPPPPTGRHLLTEAAVMLPPDWVPVPGRSPSAAATSAGDEEGDVEKASSTAGSGRPVVLVMHGGPHSNVPAFLMYTTTFLVAAGYAVALVNFRGSTGYGEDVVNSLPGRCGDRDTSDCADVVAACQAALREQKDGATLLDETRVVLWGGSHGGFLGAALLAQHPESFATACLRNPVIDIAAMASATDIPEWCVAEGTGERLDERCPVPTLQQHERMWAASPASQIQRITKPVLLGIGDKDLRVPTFNAKMLHQALRAKGVPTRLLAYANDSHPMGSYEAETEWAANCLAWMRHFV